MGGTGVIDRFLEVFTRYIDSGFGLLNSEVAFLATTLVAIDIILAAIFWSWGGDEDIIARLAKKTLFVGVFAYNTRKLIARTQGATIKELTNAFAQKLRGNKPSLIAIRKQVRRHSTSKQRHPTRGLVYYMATPNAA